MSIFKDYKKFLDFSCDKAGKVYVNVSETDANFYHFIPLNEYADCENNPIMGYDPDGKFDWSYFWKCFADIAVDVVASVAGLVVGLATCDPLIAFETIALINNAVNFTYYYFSNGKTNVNSTYYHNGYISRWDRLDYVKNQTGSKFYGINEMRYYGEYSFHMYAWIYTQKFYTGKESDNLLTQIANRAYEADVDPYKEDVNLDVAFFSYLLGLIGI